MNSFITKKSTGTNIDSHLFKASRRDFLKIGGLLTGGLVLGLSFFSCDEKGKKIRSIAPNVYLHITSADEVVIIAHRSEMGQGIRTSLPLVVADELGADWHKVRVVQAEGDEKKYGNQNTDGSFSIRMFFKPLREAGAVAKLLLIQAAAQEWQVPIEECDTANSLVVHQPSGKSIPFGKLVDAASHLPIPSSKDIQLKASENFTLIGHPTPIIDLHDIVTGKALFGIDAHIDGMKVAVVKRCPVLGGKLVSFDDKDTLEVPGVLKVLTIAGGAMPPSIEQPLSGVAVIAENTWAAIKGRELLKVNWDLGTHATYDSDQQMEDLRKAVQQKGTLRKSRGNFDRAKADAVKVIDRTYLAPHLAHATIEPPNALAVIQNGRCLVWAPTQNPQGARDAVAKAIGLSADQVQVNVTLLGGGFGRKSKPDFIVEAALLAKETGLPIKVQWTREDDLHHDFFHSLSAQRITATIDKHNQISGWNHHIAYPSISATFDTSVLQPADGELGQGASDFPYNIPAVSLETHDAKAHLRVGWLRSVRNIPQIFAIGTMLDELAEIRNTDPIQQAIELLGDDRSITFEEEMIAGKYGNYGEDIALYPWDTGRMKKVIEKVAEQSGWHNRKSKGVHLGFAAHKSFLTYVACVVEVIMDDKRTIQIPNVYYVVDCGMAVNTDRIKSQFEGGAQFSASLALKSKITLKNGAVQQDNFDKYQIIRMPESPKNIHVHIMESEDKPTGVGEPPVPPFTPALCNAIYAASGKRIYALPVDLNA